jgi:hypothetical protein
MRKHNLTPEDLTNNPDYELIEEISYSNLKTFIINEIRYKSLLIRVYSIAQVISVIALLAMVCFYFSGFILHGLYKNELITIGLSLLFSFTFLIIIHELIHAAAFLILGKRDIGFGAQWKKFLFYAESNREVLSSNEMLLVALAPFILITGLGLGLFFLFPNKPSGVAGMVVFLIHFFFCGGDFAILSFFNRHKTDQLYTFDDRKEKCSYYFRKV